MKRHRLATTSLSLLVAGFLSLGVLSTPSAKSKKAGRKDKPSFSLGQKVKDTISADVTEQMIQANIENQKMILELEDKGSPEYPEMIVALADFYWALSEAYFRKAHTEAIEQAIFVAEESGDAMALERAKNPQRELFRKTREFQEKTVKTYRSVIDSYPQTRKIDEIRYYLSYHLTAMGDTKEGMQSYTDLILKHPESPYVPDALVNIGDYYFDANDYKNALQLYEQVAQYGDAPALAYASYKQSWCLYNMGQYDKSLSRLISVIKLTRKRHEDGVQGAIDLMEEAQNELVYPYAKVGKPAVAITFFRRYAPNRYLDLASKLAEMYAESTEYQKSDKLLRTLIREARKKRKGEPDRSYMVLRFQRQIVDNAHSRVDKDSTVAEIKQLIRDFLDLPDSAPEEFVTKEKGTIDRLILEVATGYHNEYKTTKSKATLEYTQELYAEYLRIFRNAPNAYAISYNNALLLMMTGKYQRAAVEFEKLIAAQPDGKYADEAAERAVTAYLKNLQIENKDVKNEAEEVLTTRDLSKEEQRFVQAVDRWMDLIERKGVNPQTADNVGPARFAAAKINYNANRFEDAAKRFQTFVEKHSDHPFWVDAARHVLSSYSLAHDADSLQLYANRYKEDDRLMATPLAGDVDRIRNEFNFLACFKFEKREEHQGAAKCFLQYSKDYPDSERAPASIYNAGLNYFKARQVQKSLETQKYLYDSYSEHELAPKALYSIGEIYRETTVYSEAANVYEYFFDTYPKHPLAEQALRYASIFRKTLRQYDKAVYDLTLYLRAFPDPERSPRVHLDIILIRQTQKNVQEVQRVVRNHLRKYKKESPAIRLQVLAAKGRALWALGKFGGAGKVYAKVVDTYAKLSEEERAELDPVAVSATAECHFYIGEVLLKRARSIKMKGNEKKTQKSLEQKLKLMTEAKSQYELVLNYKQPGWVIAAQAQLGLAYRDLADAVENAPVPRRFKRNPELEDEYIQMMADKATPIRTKAIESYRRALQVARDFHWFNRYSERAEQAIAQLDLTDVSIKEYRLRPEHTGANTGHPDFKQEVK